MTSAKSKKFWDNNEADFAGDVSSREIIRLSGNFIGNRILDVGAGSGSLIRLIPNAIGLDLASKSPRIIEADISNMPFKSSSFDTVFATEVLEHLDNSTLTDGLREIRRILQSGGHLIITVPYNEDLRQNTVLCKNCGAKFHRWGHIQVFDEVSMVEMLERSQFDIVKIRKLPIGFMAERKFLRYARYLLDKQGFFPSKNLFVVAEKMG
jgi:ubiquinone/menaquinone biosynthesis C-methylase UbiE